MPISFISFLFVVFHPDKKAIHDIIIDSVVVRQVKNVVDPYNLRGLKKDDDKIHEIDNSFQQDGNDILKNEYYDDPADKEYKDPLDQWNND